MREPISALRKSFYKSRVRGGVSQRFSKLVNRRVQPLVEVAEAVTRPETLSQFFTANDLPGTIQKSCQHEKWLLLEPDGTTVLAQLSSGNIRFVRAESEPLLRG